MSLTATSNILIADDDHNILAALKLLLTSEGYQVTLASQPAQVVKLYQQESFDCVLLDLNFNLDTTSGEEGLAIIEQLVKIDENVPIIVMTGWATVELAVNAMQKGAVDFIQKPWENERVLSLVENHIRFAKQRHQSAKLNTENKLLKAEIGRSHTIIAQSQNMKEVLSLVQQVAVSDINVLITGENGTGKSLLAEQIHAYSQRASHSLINVNMGAISESLFESEMFGHVKGAFTDAKENRIGRFELADQGSLFLDEIGNIPLSQQGKLLRVLESQEFEKVGASKTQRSDTRIIAATNANVDTLIEQGLFRQDLLYRLNTVEVCIPPLRERTEDIIPLASHYLTHFAKKYHKGELTLSASALSALLNYAWPGNVRELNHQIERAVVLVSGNEISVEQLGLSSVSSQSVIEKDDNSALQVTEELTLPLETIEKGIIERRIHHFKGNMLSVAKSLGLSRSAFYRRIDKHKL